MKKFFKWASIITVIVALNAGVGVYAYETIKEKNAEAKIEAKQVSLEIVGELKNVEVISFEEKQLTKRHKDYIVIFEQEDGVQVTLYGLSGDVQKLFKVGDIVSVEYTETGHIKQSTTIERKK